MSMSATENFGFRMSPRSPPVHDTTITPTPSLAYFARLAAPLLDSSSGWACTAIRRSGASAASAAPRPGPLGGLPARHRHGGGRVDRVDRVQKPFPHSCPLSSQQAAPAAPD